MLFIKNSPRSLAVSNKTTTFAKSKLYFKNNGMNDIESNKGEIVMYQPDETIRLEVRMEGETVWLSANQMSLLFDRDEKTIRKHINNVFSDNEVPKDINTHFLRVDGVKQPVAFIKMQETSASDLLNNIR